MIDVKTAVRAAMNYLNEFREFVPARGVRLEETEYDDKGSWLITLSALEEQDGPLGALAGLGPLRRNYRVFRIDAETGEVKAMKVRTLIPVV